MNKKQFMNEYVLPFLKNNDKPFNRQLFNDSKDILHKEGKITDKQADNWLYPKTKMFE